MAEATQYDHDQLGHLLSDRLLEVPRFQRSYAWDRANVQEYLSDLEQARAKRVPYFMGTVVLAQPKGGDFRQQIVDGQQRLSTTAVLFMAIRDLLREYGKNEQAAAIDASHLQGYVLAAERDVERLTLSPKDQDTYDSLLAGDSSALQSGHPLTSCYLMCVAYLRKVSPSEADYKEIIGISEQLDRDVQVLVAVASDLPEAYVIFETLNDRGADLTTADLLKNYLFSQARDSFKYVENRWTILEGRFEKPDELVKFIRYHFVSKFGLVTTRKLYRAIQENVGSSVSSTKAYIKSLVETQEVYLAIKDPDSSYWSELSFDVRDALTAYRRFGFEASIPVLLAAFQSWPKPKASRFLIKMVGWTIRAQVTGRLGGSTADESFSAAAVAIASGSAMSQQTVRPLMKRIIPSDREFKTAFVAYPALQVARAKYLLAMLEQAHVASGRREHPVDWWSKAVTIEHILPRSVGDEEAVEAVGRIGNLALLEKRLNHELGGREFSRKKATYSKSSFQLTKGLSELDVWDLDAIECRTAELAELACRAWPAR